MASGATGTVYGFRSQNEANRFRDLLVAHFRPWVPGGLKMVQDALQVERDLPRGMAFSHPSLDASITHCNGTKGKANSP